MKKRTRPVPGVTSARSLNPSTASHEVGQRKVAFAVLAVLALIWGYNWVVVKIALSYAPPIAFSALRAAAAAAFLFVLLALCGKSLRAPVRPLRLALLALFQTTGFLGLISWALALGDAGKTAILAYTMPFWVLLLAAPILRERLTGAKVLAGGCGLTGIIMIFSPWTVHGDRLGMMLAIAAGADWAIAVLIAKTLRVQGMWALLGLNAWQALIGCLPLAAVALIVHAGPIRWTPAFIVTLFYSAVLGTGVAWAMWLFVLSRLSASLSGLAALSVPVIGILADWAQLGTRPGPWESLGAATLIAGLALIAWIQRRSAV